MQPRAKKISAVGLTGVCTHAAFTKDSSRAHSRSIFCGVAGNNGLDMLPGRLRIPNECLSGYERFESFDPAEGVENEYAIVHVELRGFRDSEGVIPQVLPFLFPRRHHGVMIE